LEKLCEAADHYERHMQYPDIYYLYFDVDGQETVIELSCLGTEHTGSREMEIRKSHVIILAYAMNNATSFHELANITEDLKMRKREPPIVLVCNEDELVEEDRLSIADGSSISEGYESDNANNQIKRHPSMEKIRKSQEQSFITKEQGEAFAKQLGNDSQFLSEHLSRFGGTRDLLLELLRKLNSGRKSSTSRRRSTVVEGLKNITLPFQKSKKNREREESGSSTSGDITPDSSPSHSPSVDQPSTHSSISHIEVQQEETVFPTTKSEPNMAPTQRSKSLFHRNQVSGSDSRNQPTQSSNVCSIM
jgi:GTPase SAR1 family protein